MYRLWCVQSVKFLSDKTQHNRNVYSDEPAALSLTVQDSSDISWFSILIQTADNNNAAWWSDSGREEGFFFFLSIKNKQTNTIQPRCIFATSVSTESGCFSLSDLNLPFGGFLGRAALHEWEGEWEWQRHSLDTVYADGWRLKRQRQRERERL